jgi:hypothetical protein
VIKSCESPQDLTLPSGAAKIGTHEYTVSINSSPVDVLTLNDVPVKSVIGSLIYIQDVAHVQWMGGSTERLPCGRDIKRTVVSDGDIRNHTRYHEADQGRHAAHVKSGGARGEVIVVRDLCCFCYAQVRELPTA